MQGPESGRLPCCRAEGSSPLRQQEDIHAPASMSILSSSSRGSLPALGKAAASRRPALPGESGSQTPGGF